MKILVCDDQPTRCKEIASRIRASTRQNPRELSYEDLEKELTRLFEDVDACIKSPNKHKGGKYKFDDVDILVLDNNLAHLKTPGSRLTAESIAGYIRAFTTATYIVSLNKNPDVDFDLRYLVGDYATRADVAVNNEHLGNLALWSGNSADAVRGFRPWYWPSLSTVAGRRRKQIEFVFEHLDESIVETLGFDDEAISYLSLHAKGALSPEAESDRADTEVDQFKALTFRQVFLTKDRSIPSKEEREALSTASLEKGSKALGQLIARVVAADIDLWFRRDIVGPQEPLIDIPHLIVRFPFLLGDRANNIDEWNKTIIASEPPYGLDKQLYDKHLADNKFEHDEWVPTPCFWWPKLKADERLNDYFLKDRATDWADLVFCEDRSAFLDRFQFRPPEARGWHLIVRFPFFLGDRANNIDEWNKTIIASEPPYGLDKQLYDKHLADNKFEHDEWVPTPCFWWPKLKADERLNDYFLKDRATDWADLVFCEDRSAFLDRLPQDQISVPREFPAEFESSWERRYVSRIEGVKYAPRSRLAL